MRPDGDRAAELLKPYFGPVLPQRSGEEFEVSEDFKPFVQVEFEILFGCGAEEAAAPAATSSVSYRLTDGAARGEEEEVDVWIHLAYYAEVDVKMQVECLERNVRSETAILPLVAKGVGGKRAVFLFHHQDDRVQDTGHGC